MFKKLSHRMKLAIILLLFQLIIIYQILEEGRSLIKITGDIVYDIGYFIGGYIIGIVAIVLLVIEIIKKRQPKKN